MASPNLFSEDTPDSAAEPELDLSPPPFLNRPLWRSLLTNVLDRISPEKLPPIELTSKPVDVGMLVGDMLDVPWYRTVFSNLGEVVSPETLPPLELESRPVEVGELIADQVNHPWWTSLAGSVRDALAGDTAPPLTLTSKAVNPEMASTELLVPRWSGLLTTPKVFLPDKANPGYARATAAPLILPPLPSDVLVSDELDPATERRLRVDLKRSKIREVVWVSLAAAEVLILLAPRFLR